MLLEQVDRRVRKDLAAWFDIGAMDGDAQIRSIQRMGHSILSAIHEMNHSQVEIWRRSIETAQAAWVETLEENHSLVQRNLGDAVGVSVKCLADQMSESLRQLDAALEHRGQQWQVHLSQLTRQIHDQQQSVITTGQAVLQALRTATPPANSATYAADAAELRRTLQGILAFLQDHRGHHAPPSQTTPHDAAAPVAVSQRLRRAMQIFKEDRAA
jgi:hypothetical protein